VKDENELIRIGMRTKMRRGVQGEVEQDKVKESWTGKKGAGRRLGENDREEGRRTKIDRWMDR